MKRLFIVLLILLFPIVLMASETDSTDISTPRLWWVYLIICALYYPTIQVLGRAVVSIMKKRKHNIKHI